MSERGGAIGIDASKDRDGDVVEFALGRNSTTYSGDVIRSEFREVPSLPEVSENDISNELSGVNKILAEPKLPAPAKENRARLQMQSPNRLYFYWSLDTDPFQRLNRALKTSTSSYALVLKIRDLKRRSEKMFLAEAAGSYWFDVEADGVYRAEIGFYAPNRPYVRAIFSNVVETPRKGPSPHNAEAAEWAVSADIFARVLDVAGFSQDAFDVAIAGDDIATANQATRAALSQLVGTEAAREHSADDAEIRYALLALASGYSLEELRGRVSPALFALLLENAGRLGREPALSALIQEFDIETDELVPERTGSKVFGASALNFPRILRKRIGSPKLSPVSSSGSGAGAN